MLLGTPYGISVRRFFVRAGLLANAIKPLPWSPSRRDARVDLCRFARSLPVFSFMRSLRIIFVWAPLLFVFALLGLSCVAPWSPMCRSEHDMNLVSGRTRVIYRVAFMPMRETAEATELSRIVNRPDDPAQWVRVCTFCPGISHSPHHRYHSAGRVCMSFELVKWDAEAKRLVCEHFLRRLREEGDDKGGGDFSGKVAGLSWRGRSVDVETAKALIKEDIRARPSSGEGAVFR